MSCIYGPRQFGTEDQGWVAHFLHPAPCTASRSPSIGDGHQVRDAAVRRRCGRGLLLALRTDRPSSSGSAFNLGGGPGNTLSLLELLGAIGQL